MRQRGDGRTVLLHVWLLEQKQSSAHRMQSERYQGQPTTASMAFPDFLFHCVCCVWKNKSLPLSCPQWNVSNCAARNLVCNSNAFVSHPYSGKMWMECVVSYGRTHPSHALYCWTGNHEGLSRSHENKGDTWGLMCNPANIQLSRRWPLCVSGPFIYCDVNMLEI